MPDYEKKDLEWSVKIKYVLQGVGISALFAYMFYRSFLAFFILLPLLYLYMKKRKKEYIKERKKKIGLQFRELMNCVLSGLQAGYSIENAFVMSYGDMKSLFGEKSVISKELLYIKKSLHNNQNLEDLLSDFAERSHNEDIKDFADVFKVAKRSGGNLPNIIRSTVDVINTRIDVSRKIETLVSAKKMEQSIMNVVPFAILLYINASSPGFFDSLYHNLTGIIIMSVLLAVYIAAYLLAEKIIQIEL